MTSWKRNLFTLCTQPALTLGTGSNVKGVGALKSFLSAELGACSPPQRVKGKLKLASIRCTRTPAINDHKIGVPLSHAPACHLADSNTPSQQGSQHPTCGVRSPKKLSVGPACVRLHGSRRRREFDPLEESTQARRALRC